MTERLFNLLDKSKSPFHVVLNIVEELEKKGFREIKEQDSWKLKKGKYFVKRNDTSIIAFSIGDNLDDYGFNIVAAHTDSPTFKLKPKHDCFVLDYNRLNVEPYGGALYYTFLDRPLGVAGRVITKNEKGIKTNFVDVDKDLLVIPSMPIHFNREANTGLALNPQVDMLPLYALSSNPFIKELDVKDEILSFDLYLYPRYKAHYVLNDEAFMSPKIDDLECVYSALLSMLDSNNKNGINVCAFFDNEEVGSQTKQGAASCFLSDTLLRINKALGFDEEKYLRVLSNSLMVSADNAHAVNPSHLEKYDQTNRVFMNKGIVIKYNANNSYTTDAISSGLFKVLCSRANVEYQEFTNRSDVRGGGTLGAISSSQLSILSVDMGAAQMAMHSAVETAGVRDFKDMIKVFKEFFNSSIIKTSDGYEIRSDK